MAILDTADRTLAIYDRDGETIEAQARDSRGFRAVEDLCRRLAHSVDGSWIPIADWARFFLRLGGFVAMEERARPLVVGVAVPTRAYAAALCAAGAVSARVEVPANMDVTTHVAFLKRLPRDTTVVYRPDATTSVYGWYCGISRLDGLEYVNITTTKSLLRRVPTRDADKIELTPRQLGTLPAKEQTKVLKSEAGLVGGVLDQRAIGWFIGQSRLDAVIVGNESRLRSELVEPLAISRPGRTNVSGKLQDIVRPQHAARRTETFRTLLVSSANSPRPMRLDGAPAATIFDGAGTFLRWHDAWRGVPGPCIVILDRTEPRFADAVSELDGMFASREVEDLEGGDIPQVPPGSELVIFVGQRR